MKRKTKTIFALDIGTRSIVGLLMVEGEDGTVTIRDIIAKEHLNRAMLDGQIHNIPQVSSLVKEVKKELEERTGTKLKKVAVAAAGRALRTIKSNISMDIDNQAPIKKEEILNLELRAAQQAQSTLLDSQQLEDNSEYYCVGYSTIKYYLDNNEIGSLVGQKGFTAGLEIVAAFLPKVVLESLQAVLTENGLELANITLEPIAAINAILPPTMRKLNLALVDIGAGTSDIAISQDGSIIGYGMVPVAGDEITEALCEQHLLDFNEGEALKRGLIYSIDNPLEFTDILGISHEILGSQLVLSIEQVIKDLAEKIKEEIIKLNHKPPQAVILIGGGSLTPLLSDYIAEFLGLPKQRVAVQKASSIKEINNLPQSFYGPEIITPIGIGLTAVKNLSLGFIPVQVNKFSINLLNLGKNTVADGLLAAGIDTGRMYGRPGLALSVEVNGKLRLFPGTLGEKASIKLNGMEAGLDTILKPRDKIEFIKAKDGLPGKGFVKDILPSPNYVKFNGQKRQLPYEVTINGQSVDFNTPLDEGNKVFVRESNQLAELLETWQDIDPLEMINISLVIEGNEKKLTYLPYKLLRNGNPVNFHDIIYPEDEIVMDLDNPINYTIQQIIESEKIENKDSSMVIYVNEEPITFEKTKLIIKLNGVSVKPRSPLVNGDTIEITFKDTENPLLLDIFSKIKFSSTPPPGKAVLHILINDKEGEYTSPIAHGDKITLQWN
ncbi:MAG: cell division protein FtsA [Bacillota bacterium]